MELEYFKLSVGKAMADSYMTAIRFDEKKGHFKRLGYKLTGVRDTKTFVQLL